MAINFPTSPSLDDTHTENSLAWVYNGTSWIPQNPTFDLPTSPAGSVSYHAATTAPTGWLKANGALIDRTTYADLFAVVGETYGAGDGSTTFALPDLRGEFLRSYDDGRGIDTGRTLGDSQSDEIEAHDHYISVDQTGGDNPTATNSIVTRRTSDGSVDYSLRFSDSEPSEGQTSSTGGTETRPRNIALLAIIKY